MICVQCSLFSNHHRTLSTRVIIENVPIIKEKVTFYNNLFEHVIDFLHYKEQADRLYTFKDVTNEKLCVSLTVWTGLLPVLPPLLS